VVSIRSFGATQPPYEFRRTERNIKHSLPADWGGCVRQAQGNRQAEVLKMAFARLLREGVCLLGCCGRIISTSEIARASRMGFRVWAGEAEVGHYPERQITYS